MFGLCQCRGALHIFLSPAGLTAAFKATLEMTGEKVPCQLGCWERKRKEGGCGGERKREGRGEKRGYKWERKNNGLTLSEWTLSQTEGEEGGKHHWDKQVSRDKRKGDEGREEEERSDRGKVKLASLPSGSAASQWRLTGKESNAPNRTHRGHRCVYICVF